MASRRYMDIVTDIKEQISSGVLKPGSKIKSENELSEEYGLSRQTVRHSIAVLEEDGLVRRVKGSGTYIAENALTDRAGVTAPPDHYVYDALNSLNFNKYSLTILDNTPKSILISLPLKTFL